MPLCVERTSILDVTRHTRPCSGLGTQRGSGPSCRTGKPATRAQGGRNGHVPCPVFARWTILEPSSLSSGVRVALHQTTLKIVIPHFDVSTMSGKYDDYDWYV